MALYINHYWRLAPILLDLMRHGVRVDSDRMAHQYAELRGRCKDIQNSLDDLVGATACTCSHHIELHEAKQAPTVYTKSGKEKVHQPKPTFPCTYCTCLNFDTPQRSLVAEKDLSQPTVINYLYYTLQLPKQRQKGEDSLTANEVALRKLRLKVADTKAIVRPGKKTKVWKTKRDHTMQLLDLLLEHREAAKLSTYCEPTKRDPDGRLRCMYKVTTDPGRLASAKNPMGTGYNLQNVPRGPFRESFLPDEGCFFLAVDYSQSESRFVKVLSKDPEAIRQARLRPSEWDDHSEGARRIFSRVLGIPESEVDVTALAVPGTTRRQLAKPVRHGVNYGEGASKIQDSLLKDGVVLDLAMCKQLLVAGLDPYVIAFQRETRRRIIRHRLLTNSWGRELDFTGYRFNDEAYRRGYAFRGASENAGALNQLGLIPLHHWLRRNAMRSHINLQCHDELVISVFPDEAWDVLVFIVSSMEIEREVEGIPISIPVEPKIGLTWACPTKYIEMPTRRQFDHDVRHLLDQRRAA